MEKKEEINIQPEQNAETRIQNNEERLRNLQDKAGRGRMEGKDTGNKKHKW